MRKKQKGIKEQTPDLPSTLPIILNPVPDGIVIWHAPWTDDMLKKDSHRSSVECLLSSKGYDIAKGWTATESKGQIIIHGEVKERK